MPALSVSERDAVRRLFDAAARPVDVAVLHDGGRANPEFAEALDEVRRLVPRLTVEERPWRPEDRALAERAPAVVLRDAERRPLRVRFLGYPLGYEFGAFVQDLADAARASTQLSEATLKALAEVREPVRIQVFTTPT